MIQLTTIDKDSMAVHIEMQRALKDSFTEKTEDDFILTREDPVIDFYGGGP